MEFKVAITPAELLEAVKNQIVFLKNACKQYDNGECFYSIEIAIKIRVLLYDTKHSKSAFHQLCNMFDFENPVFMDSRNIPNLHFQNEGNCNFVSSHMCQYSLNHYPDSPPVLIPLPKLNSVHCYLSFNDWWENATVFQYKDIIMSRKTLIALVADQDGGAHIDPKINNSLAALKRKTTTTIQINIPFKNSYKTYISQSDLILYAIIRTIANEVLNVFEKSIIPLCEEKLNKDNGT